MSDDEEEMRQLRQSKRFQEHESQYGPRKRVKTENEEESKVIAEAFEALHDDTIQESEQTASLQDGDTITEANIAEAAATGALPEDNLEGFVPLSFGKKQTAEDYLLMGLAETRKKKPKPAAPKPKVSKRKEEKVYIFGVNNPPQLEEDDLTPVKVKEEPEEEVEYEEIDENNYLKIPYAHEVIIRGHQRAVTALGLDPAGARMLTGGHDYVVKFWDFPAMDRNFRSFREIEPHPEGNYLIHTLQFSLRGDKFLLASSSPQAKLYDRDGVELAEFAKGYQYLSDMSQTKGHVANITDAFWHVNDPEVFFTASQDSTIRIWDINDTKQQRTVIKVKNERGMNKLPITAAVMDPNGKLVFCAGTDGSLQAFAAGGPYLRYTHKVQKGHQPNTDTSDLCFSKDAYTLLSRGGDGTLKVWDIRNFKSPVKTFEDLPNSFPETSCLFSPDETTIVTAYSAQTGTTGGLLFIDKQTLEEVKKLDVSSESVVAVLWHPKINQIICGSSDGNVHVLFDPQFSQKGVLYSISKAPRKPKVEPALPEGPIVTPHALPMFKEPPSLKKQREKARKDPILSRKPEAPQVGVGSKGRIGTSLTADIMKNFVHKDKEETTKDPREAILKYAEKAKANPKFFKVYGDTQILDYEGLERYAKEQEELEERRRKMEELLKQRAAGK